MVCCLLYQFSNLFMFLKFADAESYLATCTTDTSVNDSLVSLQCTGNLSVTEELCSENTANTAIFCDTKPYFLLNTML